MHLLIQIIWDINPIAFSIGNFEFRWYGLMYALAFIICYFIALKWFRKENKPLDKVANLSIYILIAGILGARLGEFLFYDFSVLKENPSVLFNIKNGGMASHGAFFAIVLFSFFYSQKNKFISFFNMLDKLAILGALIVALMRIGNLFNSELIGKATSLPFAFVFKKVDSIPRHPTVLYEAIIYFVLFFIFYHFKDKIKTEGLIFTSFLLLLVPFRYLLEFTKENASTSQTLNLVLIFIGLLSLIWIKSKRKIIFTK